MSRAALAVIMLPVEILREILNYLDTKLLHYDKDNLLSEWNYRWVYGEWSGTGRMRNSLQIRRRVGQTEFQLAGPA